MRISDWSSDVCSSDLYTPRELEAQVEDSGTDLLVTVSAAALLPTALAVLDGSSLKQLVVGSVAGGLPAAKSLLYRSEENTSELQSLMRNSYAVFCLTKQHNNNN